MGGLLVGFPPGYMLLFMLSGVIAMAGVHLVFKYTEDDRGASFPMKPGVQVEMILSEPPSAVKRLMGDRKVLAA